MDRTLTTPCNTKIVCTLGPASSSEERLEAMIKAGMDVCRLNFSHGEHSAHKEIFDRIRNISAKYNNQVAILCDIQGQSVIAIFLVRNLTVGKRDECQFHAILTKLFVL